MPELFLHYIWLRRAFLAYPQQTTDGKQIEVVNTGIYNTDAGPDFSAAVIRIGETMWTGNVEMHVRASDWYRHKHNTDRSYDSVILHVVCVADKKVYNSRGEAIEQCELKFSPTEEQLHNFITHRREMCSASLRNNPQLLTEHWKTTLLHDRMQRKTEDIQRLLALTHNSWEDSFYITLAHNFGFHTNGVPFEMLAKQTPLAFLRKHRQSLFQMEAMLLGQSGLLTRLRDEEQTQRLAQEYEFLKHKFSLTPVDAKMWKHLRMRPQNFPEVRIKQFALLLHRHESLFAKLVFSSGIKEMRETLTFEGEDREGIPPIGKASQDILITNSVIPYIYAYGESTGDEQMKHRAYELLAQLPAEKNHIIEEWKTYGFEINTAAESQTFLHLTQQYCCRDKCYDCEVGYHIFTIEK